MALGAAAARADEVILRDGTEVQGEVLAGPDDGPVRLAVERGRGRVVVEIPRAEVRYVRRLGGEDQRLSRRAEEALLGSDVPAAVRLLEQLVARRPDDPRAHRELGFALLLANRDAAAATRLERACDLDRLDFEAHLALAQALQRLERLDQAIDRFREAAGLGPSHPGVWRALAQLLLARRAPRDREEALRALRRAQQAAPRDEDAAVEHAAAWLEGGRPDDRAQARRVLSDYVARVPGSLRAGRLLAQLLAAQGEHAGAAAQTAALLARRDLAPPLREALEAERALYAWLAAGAAAVAPEGLDAGAPQCELARAARQLDALLDLTDHPGLALARARVALRAGNAGPAAELLERLTLEAPPPVAADALLLQRVAAALLAERPLEADGLAPAKARRLVALAPWLATAHRALGRALEREGDFAAAAAAYEAGAAVAADSATRDALGDDAARARGQADRQERHGDL